MDMRVLIGRNFARLRREREMTQEAVMAASGFTQPYLSGLEQGRRNPSIVTLYEIALALDVGVLDLLAGADDDRRPKPAVTTKAMSKPQPGPKPKRR